MDDEQNPFAHWLNVTMQSRGLSQAELARAVGVADTQVSRWRRGQVVPTLRYLQQIADTFDVPRTTLDRLAGYPVAEAPHRPPRVFEDAAELAELAACEAHFRQVLEEKIPRALWQAYMEACDSLAEALSASYRTALEQAPPGGPAKAGHDHDMGFRRRARDEPRLR
jgi:transcriptional regulator with XRE-family HTH domain